MRNSKLSYIAALAVYMFAFSICFNSIISNVISPWALIIVRVMSIATIVLYRLHTNNYKISGKYLILVLLTLLPYFYNNAYFYDSIYMQIANYALTIIFAVMLSGGIINNRPLSHYFLKAYSLFAVITIVVTAFSLVMPSTYLTMMKMLLSNSQYIELKRFLLSYHSLAGLTDHYSRNAFYVTIGLFYYFYSRNDEKSVKHKYCLISVVSILALLVIGKRAHLLFAAIAIAIAFVIYRRIKVSTIAKVCSAIVVTLAAGLLVIHYVPVFGRTIERIVDIDGKTDYSNGRLEMYKDAKRLYVSNDNKPIGWGQYAKSTNYYHPALHNDYLQLYYEVGLNGLLLIVIPNSVFLIMAIKRARNNKDSMSKIILAYNIFFMTYSMTGLPRYDVEVYSMYYVLNTALFIGDGEKK